MIASLRRWYTRRYGDWILDHALRYLAVADELRRLGLDRPTLLEVGSSRLGITPYWPGRVVGLDLDFPPQVSPRLIAVRGDAQRLPFKDRAIDVALACAFLEHLPASHRAGCLGEMVRVARKAVVLVAPSGPASEKQDERLHALYLRLHG